MGIGFRQSKHDTLASRKIVEAVGVPFDDSSDFSEGDRVMTVDGVPGTVVGVHLGFAQGAESYDVTLDDNLGGGEYTSSQLSKQPAHTGSLGTAAESYPELGTILVERPDPAKIVTYATKKVTAASEKKCKLCGEWVDVDFDGMNHHLEKVHGIEKSSMAHEASILATAAADPDFRFHVTASWSDVRNKAKRIRSEGGVHITATSKGMFHAEVRGDHGVYETSIQRLPGKSAIANWSCGCFLSDAPITLADGTRVPVSLLKEGDLVITHTGDQKPVVKAWEKPYSGTKSTVRLVGDDEAFVATGDHKVWAKKDGKLGWYEIQDLAVGDFLSRTMILGEKDLVVRVPKPQKRNPSGSSGVRGVRRYRNKARPNLDLWEFKYKSGGRDGRAKSRYFHTFEEAVEASDSHYASQGVNINVDVELARLLGWYAAEGHRRKDSYEVGWTLNSGERDIAEQLMEICYRRFGAKGSIRKTGENKILFRVSSWQIHGLVGQMIFGDRAPQKTLSQSILLLPRAEQEAFLYGLLGGDGNYSSDNGALSISSSSPQLLRQTRDILLRLGEMGSIRKVTDNNSGGLETTRDAGANYRLSWSPGAQGRSGLRYIEGDTLFSKITKTDTLPFEGEVWDVEVADDHSFRAFDVNVHNCKWGSFHWGAPDDFSRFAGRMCSHALALQHEAQSRGMFGRNIEADDTKPSWVPKMVKVKYDIDSGRHVEAPHTKVSSLSPLSVMLSRTATLAEREAMLTQITMSGVDYDTLSRTAASAWQDEPTSQVPSYLSGATSPAMPETNPASTGFATGADPRGWQEAAENPTPLSQQYAMRREAYDNPLSYGGAYPTGHYIDLDELRRQVYKRVAPTPEGGPAAAPANQAVPATGTPAAPTGTAPAPTTTPPRRDMNHEIARGVAQMAAPAMQYAVQRARPVVQNVVRRVVEDRPMVAPVSRAASLDDELGFEAVLHDEPEGALPFTEGGDDEHDDGESVVEQFQRSAAARFLSPTAGEGSGDIADAAKEFLAKEALKSFTPAEQSMIINEGQDVRARNRDRMNITGTHYEDLEKTFSDDEWMS